LNIQRLFSFYKTVSIICCLLFTYNASFAQQAEATIDQSNLSWKEKLQTISLRMPLDIPIYLAGNFCELRPNHFHGGIDIKTEGKSGLKVYASDHGYISRIKVSPYGYGKAIYIHHPGTGLTTVYAHLSKFEGKIAKAIKKLQYQKEKYALDINPKPEDFPISKGQFIAFSGNSGGSHAPHLHYEIRESKNQQPINPLYYPFDIADHISPDINGLVSYSLDPENVYNIVDYHKYALVKNGNHYHIKDTVEAPLLTSFGIKCYDRSDGMKNLNGVYQVEMTVDSIPHFAFTMDQFSFSESKYINSFIDYSLYKKDQGRFIKCFVEPMNRLSLYPEMKDKGILRLENEKVYAVHFTVTDNHGNKSYLDFTMKGIHKMQCLPDPSEFKAKCGSKSNFQFDGASIHLSENALYSDEYLDLHILDTLPNAVTPRYSIHKKTTPLHQKAELKLPIISSVDKQLKAKSCLVLLDKKGNWQGVNSKVSGNTISGKIKYFGIYTAFLDTLAPEISLVNITENKNMSERISIRVKAVDALSGIANYRGFIDGKWVLMAYDAKNDLFIHNFENAANGTKHLFEFHVTDKRDNKSVIKINYTR